MAVSTLTSKGQVTIPKRVRDRLLLRRGDKLDFRIEEDGTIRILPIAKRVNEVFGAFSHKATRAISAEEIQAGLRQAFRQGRL